jgi:hypothetical protein
MNWTIARDGYFVASCERHRFELGEMGKGRWLLKHFEKGWAHSFWYEVTSAEDGKAKAEELSK